MAELNKLIETWLASYRAETKEGIFQAKREIMQEITLAGLARGGFFDHATFYGGTALRVFYQIDRFSEDLDFSLNYKDHHFSIQRFIPDIVNEFQLLDLDVQITIKEKQQLSAIESAFLKEDTHWGILNVNSLGKNPSFPTVKIKIEVDRDPPLHFESEPKLLLRPYSFYVNCMKEEFLFAGKMHAVLFRQWRSRVKGRDWYDFEWFIKRGTPLHLAHLQERSIESGHWPADKKLNKQAFMDLLASRIEHLNIHSAQKDIQNFIDQPDKVAIWSTSYFLDLAKKINFN